jgi:hypothetical protein
MSEPCESSLQETAFVQFLPARSREVVARRCESAPTSLPMKRSFAAGAFLLVCLAAYIGVGFAGIALLERAWSAVFQ